MPTGLYGDLELVKSIGHTPLSPATFFTPTVVAYISGNSINFLDVAEIEEAAATDAPGHPASTAEGGSTHVEVGGSGGATAGEHGTEIHPQSPAASSGATPSQQQELRSVVAGSQIVAFAVQKRESVVAYSERDSMAVKVVKWPSGAVWGGSGTAKMEASKDLSIHALAFSPDTQYLAALGTLPTHTITIWDWRTATLVCEVPNGAAAEFISFDPLDSRRICTSGGEGGIRFWRLEIGFKRSGLVAVKGKPIFQPDHESLAMPSLFPKGPHPNSHAWTIDEQIVCTTSSGCELVHYDPVTGDHRVYASAAAADGGPGTSGEDGGTDEPGSRGEGGDDEDSENRRKRMLPHGQIEYVAVAKDGLYVAGKDGVLRLHSFATASVTKTIDVTKGESVASLSFAPDYRRALIESVSGKLFVYNVVKENVIEILHTPNVSNLTVHHPSSTLITAATHHLDFQSLDADIQRTNTFKKLLHLHRISLPPAHSSHITSVAASPFAQLAAAGTADGCVRVYDFRATNVPPRLVVRDRVFANAVDVISFDPAGRYLAATSHTDKRIALVGVLDTFGYAGFTTLPVPPAVDPTSAMGGRVKSAAIPITTTISRPTTSKIPAGAETGQTVDLKIRACAWKLEEELGVVHMFVLASGEGRSYIYRVPVPLEIPPSAPEGDGAQQMEREIPLAPELPIVIYRIDDTVDGMTIVPSHLSAGRDTFYVTSNDGRLKTYEGPQRAGAPAAPVSSAKKAEPAEEGGEGERAAPKKEPVRTVELIVLSSPGIKSRDHEKSVTQLLLHPATSWVTTTSLDGRITVRTLMEPDKSYCLYVHDPFLGGVRGLAATLNCRAIITAGADGILRLWEWKYNAAGRRSATEVGGVVERMAEAGEDVVALVNDRLGLVKKLSDLPEAALPPPILPIEGELSLSSASAAAPAATGVPSGDGATPQQTSVIQTRLNALRERLLRAIVKNESLPPLERLDKEEFILDYEMREKLQRESGEVVEGVRQSIEEEWLRRRVVGNRIKRDCWDSMATVGQTIKSFHPDPLTNTLTTVTNYPIRKMSAEETERVDRVVMLRRSQILVNAATVKAPPKKPIRDTDGDEDASEDEDASNTRASKAGAATNQPTAPKDGVNPAVEPFSLLYSPFELTTSERRRIQAVILSHAIHVLKTQFNAKFDETLRLKRDEMGRIEERGDRAKGIMEELGWTNAGAAGEIFRPVLHDDEVPERVVEVRDEEVTAEKFITAEEQVKLAEKQRLEAERAKAAAKDNWRDRALNQMMNNTLADRASEEESGKMLVQKPDFMVNKPPADWTDEERKHAKEYEKKLSVQKEEQEKTRKALETELKKLLAGIQELCDGFDTNVIRNGLFVQKLATDTRILTYEMTLLKLHAFILYAEEDEGKEAAINEALEQCKEERSMVAAEIPELKKQLERVRDDYDAAVKRDKEVEKTFKREFGAQGLESWWEPCWRLFKRKGAGEEDPEEDGKAGEELNPYTYFAHVSAPTQAAGSQVHRPSPGQQPAAGGQGQHHSRPGTPSVAGALSVAVPIQPSAIGGGLPGQPPALPPALQPLNASSEVPDGLPPDMLQNLWEHIQRKHISQTEVYNTYNSLQHLQITINQILAHSAALASRTATLHTQIAEFQLYKFNQTYDFEVCLEGLKQGQVEVPQAPVVTDYSGAVLIGRDAVERLNDVICGLGKAKVDALNEMKEYRKGIHALEWENQTLDFASETLLYKTRDIQLLRVTKHMQEYIRGGDERKQAAEIAALEKRGDYSIKAHQHNLEEKRKAIEKFRQKVAEKLKENERLDRKLEELSRDVGDRKKILRRGAWVEETVPIGDALGEVVSVGAAQAVEPPLPRDAHRRSPSPREAAMAKAAPTTTSHDPLPAIYARRRLIDMARSQAQDIGILREEVERLRLRTYPAFPARRPEF
ncbi:uncharacterized protein EV422DRAFT_618503 [Fimicolochytrium jonesii]|uniref:uncharacterized protein n=1 Tax=Fimicolochytrium jonesii TaxID=1396493 RepID=UPI0022FDC1B2|nr:uncharacterized protein EV422DRAFT_618503 [Fimicolochytrium jonesii]KAI8823689.1 hypothetical protein EV422DRAFT_618503 [Fimicolochytrium jonesii]